MADDLRQPILKDGNDEDYEPGCCSKFAGYTGLCCFMNENEYKHQPLAEVVQNDKRQCTDLPCCFALLACIISEIVLLVYAATKGASPSLLMHGYDARMTVQSTPENVQYSSAQICDSSNPMGAYAVWPNLAHPSIRICAPNCAYTNDTSNVYIPGVSDGKAMFVPYESTPFLNSYCLPTGALSVPDSFESENESYQRAIADLQTTAWLIFIMSFAAILLSYIFLRIISCIGRLLIFMTIVTILVSGGMLCWLLIDNGIDDMDDEETANTGKAELILGIILAVLLFFFILALWFMRKNIAVVLEMLNEASYAISDMSWTLVFPVWISLAVMAFVTVWIVEALYIYSVKTETTPAWPTDFFADNPFYSAGDNYYQLQFNDDLQDAMIWHIIMLLYLSQVLIYFGYMVLASTFGDWYFSLWSDHSTKKKQRGEGPAELSNSPILESLWRVFRYHLGSLAFGAAIITIIRVIRAVVTYIQAKVTASNPNNPLIKCLFCCVQCCLKCCQFVFDRVNKESFVFISIYGTPFCYSAYTAFKILVHSMGRTVMVEGVSKYTELFGRVSVAALNTGIAVLVLKYLPYYQDTVSSYLVPAVVIFTMTYMIAAVFMMVFEVGVESIFLCFLVDEQVHGEPKFANHSLKEIAGSLVTKAKDDDDAAKYGAVNDEQDFAAV
eukprot:CAMPEP_0202693860 /NCGR_PEP_ID=MMETSP1385-20130828/7876_1 /ASSEMBLY_ACC=CAM_ASM_000861 /TAXON_ID=933848 /ORGANISM="Elphidium margaritaceum" /LENGTH=668 /DNA_ID=CAMNT_0049349607 /DNA_START=44 /DNA_END=2050 /DNA_ORIENTATION=+